MLHVVVDEFKRGTVAVTVASSTTTASDAPASATDTAGTPTAPAAAPAALTVAHVVGWPHLFRDVTQDPVTAFTAGAQLSAPTPTQPGVTTTSAPTTTTTTTAATTCRLCLLLVPTHLTLEKLFGTFLGASKLKHIRSVTVVAPPAQSGPTPATDTAAAAAAGAGETRLGAPYTLFMTCHSPEAARLVASEVNGRAFTALGMETCYVQFVASLTFTKLKHNTGAQAGARSMSPAPSPARAAGAGAGAGAGAAAASTASTSATGGRARSSSLTEALRTLPYRPRLLSAPNSSVDEIPSCSQCLERLDANISGIHATGCTHASGCECGGAWKGLRCGTCFRVRLEQARAQAGSAAAVESDGSDGGAPRVAAAATAAGTADGAGGSRREWGCEGCTINSNLWVCCVCGHVGCGRYSNEHGLAHFKATKHRFSLQLDSLRVWDYVGDTYVHRLAVTPQHEDVLSHQAVRDKMESMSFEYSLLLTSQMEAQRQIYGERLDTIREEAARRLAELRTQARTAAAQQSRAVAQSARAREAAAAAVAAADATERELADAVTRAKLLRTENSELLAAQKEWRKKADTIKKELTSDAAKFQQDVVELEEQIRDLKFYFKTQKRGVEEGWQDVAVVGVSDTTKTAGGGSGGGGGSGSSATTGSSSRESGGGGGGSGSGKAAGSKRRRNKKRK